MFCFVFSLFTCKLKASIFGGSIMKEIKLRSEELPNAEWNQCS